MYIVSHYLINIEKNPTYLHFISLAKFISKYDTKSFLKKITKSFVGFHLIYIKIMIIILENCYYYLEF
jgi:hypothetical protein